MKKLKIKMNFALIISLTALLITGCSDKKDVQKSAYNEESNTAAGFVSATNKGVKQDLIIPESKLEWTAAKVTGQHNGTVDFSGGNLFIEDNKLTGGSFEMDFNTIKVLDITDAEMNGKLTGHLKSNDFFSAADFPKGKFVITSVKEISTDKYEISGDMTIKNITKKITFPAEIKQDGNKFTAIAEMDIDRTLWDIKYRSGKFFGDLGDKMINDNFKVKLSLKFNKNS